MSSIVLSDGARLHYVERGDATAVPVVFVHLGGSDWRYWEGELEAFAAAGYRAVAYSRRFALPNANPMIGDYSPLVDARDLAELLAALGAAPAHLVAASAGAYAALLLAAERPALARSLVLAEPPVVGWARATAEGAAAADEFLRRVWRAAGDAFRAGDPERAMRVLMDYFVAPGALDRFPPRLRERVMANARDWEAHTTSSDPFPTLDPARVRAIAVPTLLLSGDRTLPLHRHVDAGLARLLPYVRRVTVEGASHDLWADAPGRCREAALGFLGRIECGGLACHPERSEGSARPSGARDVRAVRILRSLPLPQDDARWGAPDTQRPAHLAPSMRIAPAPPVHHPATTTAMPRILGTRVPARFPDEGGPVRAILYGEAPGPLGADKSGIPFFGDRSGRLVYGALVRAGMCELTRDGEPVSLESVPWDGAKLAASGVVPHLRGAALSNAYDACPTDDGHTFRAPTRAELASPENVARLEDEIGRAVDAGAHTVVTLGRAADAAIGDILGVRDIPILRYETVRHPSAQALLFSRDRRGRGLKEMEEEWMRELVRILEG